MFIGSLSIFFNSNNIENIVFWNIFTNQTQENTSCVALCIMLLRMHVLYVVGDISSLEVCVYDLKYTESC